MLTFDRDFEVREEARRLANLGGAGQREASIQSLHDVLDLLRRYAKLIAAVVVVGTLLATIVTYSLDKVYTASSTLVFDRNDTRPYESVLELQKLERDKSAMDTEMDLVRSREFLGFVVDDLRLQEDPYFNLRLAEKQASSESTWTALKALFGDSSTSNASSSRGREDLRANIAAGGRSRDRAITRLQASVAADRRGDSLAMTISVHHEFPARAAEVANGVASNYVAWTSRLKESAAQNTVNYLRLQAGGLATSIAKKEREMAEFAARSDLAFDPRDDVLRARTEQLNTQFTVARVDEAGAWAKYNEAKQLLASTGIDSAGKVVTSELLITLRKEEGRLLRERAQLTAKFGRNHPLVVESDAQIVSNRRLINEEVGRILRELENDAEVATIRVKKFQQEVSQLQKEMQVRNLDEIRRRELERDLLSEQKRYDEVVLRLGSFDPEQEEVKATARIASFAEILREPSFPRPALIIPIAAVASLLLAVVAMFIMDGLDTRIRTARKVESIIKRPNIISIPDVEGILEPGQTPYQHMLASPHSPFARSMRSLCLAWRALEFGADVKVVMFFSAGAAEGKTTCALGMAATATLSGLRAVILDIDPKPNGAAGMLGISNRNPTLGMFLDGTTDLESIISVAPEYPFLRVINSRLGLHDHERLFQELRRRFDLVIIDPPAIAHDDDSVWLSSQVDAVLVMVAAGRTQETELLESVERLNIGRAPIVGSILNFAGRRGAGPKTWRPESLKSLWSQIRNKFRHLPAGGLPAFKRRGRARV
ncbi:polysaccharide biosynthesis tyrosine autokinase [Sinorhizobium sp. 6-70]|nr:MULTISPECIES: polysaccharide biosynthesis tyrosine autokinase [unclassified Sinorhizobium]MDK1374213.1 polysaccharide biosynthesis tyrosine autokinase [Sinorhizobium sp. 6-70]MDK1480435.1 polysaccharide biosynthesis tyrosine autokinase [Sinorhizobium sp. 6-117]